MYYNNYYNIKLYKNFLKICSVMAGGSEVHVTKLYIDNV